MYSADSVWVLASRDCGQGGVLVFVERACRCGGAAVMGGYVAEKITGGFVAGGGLCGSWTLCSGHGRDGWRLRRGWGFSREAVFSLFWPFAAFGALASR